MTSALGERFGIMRLAGGGGFDLQWSFAKKKGSFRTRGCTTRCPQLQAAVSQPGGLVRPAWKRVSIGDAERKLPYLEPMIQIYQQTMRIVTHPTSNLDSLWQKW